jgi:hypothetical protein
MVKPTTKVADYGNLGNQAYNGIDMGQTSTVNKCCGSGSLTNVKTGSHIWHPNNIICYYGEQLV